jgi:octaprenyl-diphosphate synthase
MLNLVALSNKFKKQLELVNAKLLDSLPEIELIKKSCQYLMKAGGKRIRPLMTLHFADKAGGITDKEINLATAVELLHTATLLHDDVIDNSSLRRGLPSLNKLFDNKTSILVGDYLFSKAFQLMVATGDLEALKELSDTAAIISGAEVKQLELLNKIDISLEEYLQLIKDKTAILFATAASLGARAGGKEKEIKKARAFGMNFGIRYQLKDDWSDYTNSSEILGKDAKHDLIEGKITLPIILLRERIGLENIQVLVEKKDLQAIILLLEEENLEKEFKEILENYSNNFSVIID